jgi:lactate 2-monooxygenase
MGQHFGDFQFEIYFQGLAGVLPSLPMTYSELEARGREVLSPSLRSYISGGAGDEKTQGHNVSAFERWGIMPRMLVGATERDLSVELFGWRWAAPVFLAPIGVIGLCTGDGHGDLAAARAAARLKVPMCVSTLGMDPLETVAAELGYSPGLFQFYAPADRDLAESLVHRAESAGYAGIIVTLDTWVTGWRPRDLAMANLPQMQGNCLTNYISDPNVRNKVEGDLDANPKLAVPYWTSTFSSSLTWDDLSWLRSLTSLPLILKGICSRDDTRRAIDAGADGIYCSNHGGRTANGGLSAIECLPDVVEAAGDVPVLFDSGVRTGADVVKAIALGAKAVGIGRPYVYGAALAGTEGIVHVMRSILAEADLIMAVDGYPTLADLTSDALRRVL